jgi:hypothetical protein
MSYVTVSEGHGYPLVYTYIDTNRKNTHCKEAKNMANTEGRSSPRERANTIKINSLQVVPIFGGLGHH